eukprot:scaffold1783_cov71-Attheya_sp.AAC.4
MLNFAEQTGSGAVIFMKLKALSIVGHPAIQKAQTSAGSLWGPKLIGNAVGENPPPTDILTQSKKASEENRLAFGVSFDYLKRQKTLTNIVTTEVKRSRDRRAGAWDVVLEAKMSTKTWDMGEGAVSSSESIVGVTVSIEDGSSVGDSLVATTEGDAEGQSQD